MSQHAGIVALKFFFNHTYILQKLICGRWMQSWLSCSLYVLFFLAQGTPIKDSWPDGLNLARAINYQFPQVSLSIVILCDHQLHSMTSMLFLAMCSCFGLFYGCIEFYIFSILLTIAEI